jgi:hypothetical protein
VEYLLVDTEGRVVAVLQSLRQAALVLGRMKRAGERVRVVRHDEYGGAFMSASSFVSASPLPSPRDPDRQQP